MSAPLPPPAPYPPPSAGARARNLVSRILWTAIPVGTLGLVGWAPALHVARRRRNAAGWWWVAALVAATVLECVLVSVVPSKGHDDEGAAAGAFAFGYLITATVYAWRWCGAEPPVQQPGAYASYGAWTPAGFQGVPPTPQAPYFPQTSPTAPYPGAFSTPGGLPAPAAAVPDMAAEVQAELRELRGFLGGEDAR